MTFFRSIILIFALVLQAVPAAAVAHGDAQPVCRMDCCDTSTMSCCCAEPAQAPSLPAPASTPPVAGRQLVPITLWTTCVSFLSPEAAVESPSKAHFHERRADMQPHVRLSVLFCSLLN